MKWCKKCILPNTRPGIQINEDGICNACNNHKTKEIDINWEERESEFSSLAKKYKAASRHFDCIIPVSGGKDSTWQVVKCLEYGMRPLAVTWKTPGRTKIGQDNLDNLISLGVDHIDWQINPKVEKKFMLESFKKFGTTAIPMHMALFNIPLLIALNFKIPLVIWGENSAFEYGSDEKSLSTGFKLTSGWLKKHGVTHGTTAKDWIDKDLSEKDLSSYFGPDENEIDAGNIHAIFLGHYFKWDVKNSLDVALKNGFKTNDHARTGIYDFADIDDDFISIHHWLKWYKFGITRSFDNLSLEIRNGRITREDAIREVTSRGEERPTQDINKLCHFLEITEDRFYDIAEKFRNTTIWAQENRTWKIKDFLTPSWKW